MQHNWELKKLREVCEIFSDGDWVESKDQSLGGIRLIQTGNIGSGEFKNRIEKARYISEIVFKRLRCTEIFEGDCLVSRLPDPVGRACILPNTDERMITAVDCTIIRFNPKKVISEYFVYYSQSVQYIKDVEHETSGTTRKRISRNKLGEILIPLPLLPEQRRIVAILDKAFAAIAKAKENAEKNWQNARELFQSYLQDVFDKLDEASEVSKLGKLSKINYGYTERASFNEIGPKFLRITDIQGKNVNWESVPFCKIDNKELSKYILNREDIVFARTGATTGKSYLIEAPPLAVFASYLIRVQILDPSRLTAPFLFLFFQTKTYWDNIKIGLSGSAQGGFNAKKLGELLIPLPPLPEQQRIVAKLDALALETKKLQTIYQQKLIQLEELKKSILHKAFNGELTDEE